MRTPTELQEWAMTKIAEHDSDEQSFSNALGACLVVAVQEAVEELRALRASDDVYQPVFANWQLAEIRDHFKKAGY